ncbi:MAG: helix-turn-helix domain-containing protein [Gemmatimonadaceae bacterium]
MPALRSRASDLPLLVEHGLDMLRAAATGRDTLACSPFAMRLLRGHSWPGNVRELLSVIERAAIECGFGRIEAQHLPTELRERLDADAPDARYRGGSDVDAEIAQIRDALEQTDGAVGRSAELLGMGRTTLWRKLRQYGLMPSR